MSYEYMRFFFSLIIAISIAGCAAPLPPSRPVPRLSPVPQVPRPDDFRKLGPDLRRHLLQRGQQILEAPDTLSRQLYPVPVVIQARRDITEELQDQGVRVRSVTQDGGVVITADVPLAAIPGLLALPDLDTIELAQPVPPADNGRGRKTESGG